MKSGSGELIRGDVSAMINIGGFFSGSPSSALLQDRGQVEIFAGKECGETSSVGSEIFGHLFFFVGELVAMVQVKMLHLKTPN